VAVSHVSGFSSSAQIQVVVYETHSVVPAENSEMVARLVSEMNNIARGKHAEEQGKSVMSSRVEGLETSSGADHENAATPVASDIPTENVDVKDSKGINFSETNISVSSSSY
jgi:16S rRNA C967 or C1407 C5-methylase (RsmB/RsmF family)